MKKMNLCLSIIMMLLLVVSCSKEESIDSDQSKQIASQEKELIIIDGIEYNLNFMESATGEIALSEKDDAILSDFIESHNNMSYYYDSNDVLHLFKNSVDMKNFMELENSDDKTMTSGKQMVMSGRSENYSSLELFDDTNYRNLLLKTNLTRGNSTFSPYVLEYPDLGSITNTLPTGPSDVNNKTSSIKLTLNYLGAPSYGADAYAILYRDENYGSYSFGMKVNSFDGVSNGQYSLTSTGISDLHKKKMYKKWFKKRYWGNSISSLKHWYTPRTGLN